MMTKMTARMPSSEVAMSGALRTDDDALGAAGSLQLAYYRVCRRVEAGRSRCRGSGPSLLGGLAGDAEVAGDPRPGASHHARECAVVVAAVLDPASGGRRISVSTSLVSSQKAAEVVAEGVFERRGPRSQLRLWRPRCSPVAPSWPVSRALRHRSFMGVEGWPRTSSQGQRHEMARERPRQGRPGRASLAQPSSTALSAHKAGRASQ
jgi:hypothetical protein